MALGKISLPSRTKLFAAVMYASEDACEKALELLKKKFGEIEVQSKAYNFKFTEYYAEEMGRNLKKRFVIFRRPIERDSIAKIKIFTNGVERKLAVRGKRRVNLDPGYLTTASVVLATTKDFPHRVYLDKGIFAEVTLAFKRGECSFFPWTYADFRQDEVCKFFVEVRKNYLRQLREEATQRS